MQPLDATPHTDIPNARTYIPNNLCIDRVVSAANEQAVEMFLNEEIGYLDICKVIEACSDKHQQELVIKPSLDEIVHYDN